MNSRPKFFNGHRVMSVILFLAWLAYGIPLLSFSSDVIDKVGEGIQEFAHQNKETIQSLNTQGLTNIDISNVKSNVGNELKNQRQFHIVIVLLGIGAAIMAFFSIKFWRSAIISTSILYLFIWLTSGAMAHVSFIEAYELKWTMAKSLGTVSSFFIQDIALPAVFVLTMIFIVSSQLTKKKIKGSEHGTLG